MSEEINWDWDMEIGILDGDVDVALERIDKDYKKLGGKKLTRKQRFDIEKESLLRKFVSDAKKLFEKYYPIKKE